MLEIRNINKSYGKKKALQSCQLIANKHDIVGVLGHNGCGKSTLFKSIMGLIEVDSGEIYFNHRLCNFEERKSFGYMPEQRSLFLDLTLYEQLKFLAELKDIYNEEFDHRVDSFIERFDLKDKKHTAISKLSKGQQQKVQLIAAMIHDPDVLILDEPLNGLDFYSVQLVMNELKIQASLGKIILISSHQMDFMDELCTHLFVLDNGLTLKNGKLSDLYQTYGVCVSVNADSLWQNISKNHKNIMEKGSLIEFHYSNINEAKKALSSFTKENTISTIKLHNISIGDMLKEVE